jgi:hypothetical protein
MRSSGSVDGVADVMSRFDDNMKLAEQPAMQAPRTAQHAHRIGPIPVQHGQRTQNSVTNPAPGRRAQALLAYRADANELVAATKSAARLAAEAAFAAPQVRSLAQPLAQVTVRRTRSASVAVEPPLEASDSPTIEPTARGARVFRVEAAPISPSVEAGLATLPPPTEGSTHSDSLPAEAPAIRRPRRIATDKRPGPVSHVVHAPPKRQRESEVLQRQLDLLTSGLDRVKPVLETIARAQAFSLVDERFVREWMRLSQKLDRLRAQIRAQVRWPLTSGEPWR